MPQVATPPGEVDLIHALLQQRGLVATGGNIRAIPFADAGSATDGASGANGSSDAAGASRPQGPTPLVMGDKLVDPTTKQPLGDNASNDWWKYLVGAAGGTAAAAALLRKRQGKTAIPEAEGIPLVEGETIDPLAPSAGPEHIVDGEYTEVPEAMTGNGAKSASAIGGSEAATAIAGSRTAGALPAPPLSLEAANALATRKAKSGVPVTSDTSVVRSGDAMSDLTPEELDRAKSLARQLVENRAKGNAARAKQTRYNRQANLPTGPEDEGSLFNTVVRMIREGKIPKSVLQAIP